MCDALRELMKDDLEDARKLGESEGEVRGEARGKASSKSIKVPKRWDRFIILLRSRRETGL